MAASQRKLAVAIVVGALIALLLVAINVARHPESLQGRGRSLLLQNIGLLLACAAAGTWVSRQQDTRTAALTVGWQAGVLLGCVAITNHLIELFAPPLTRTAQFVFGAGPVCLMIALFAVAGSVARERTQSILCGVLAGMSCALVALLILLSIAFASNLFFESRAELRLREAFIGSGMSNPGAFLVQNSLDAASEHLVRMPVLAFLLSFMGGVANAWITGRSRITVFALSWLTPAMLVAGGTALWYANSLQRTARPPFVMAGVLLTAIALSAIHPIWSARHRTSMP